MVSRKGDFLQSSSQSVPIYISFIQNYSEIKSGMFLTAEISSIPILDSYEIPRRALVDNQHVFVVRDSTLVIRDVKIEASHHSNVIVSGISEEDMVVVEPIINAKEGMSVNPIMNIKSLEK